MFKLIVLLMAVSASYGMDCTFGTSDSLSDKIFNSCPRLLIDSSDQKYCCPETCCDIYEFVKQWSEGGEPQVSASKILKKKKRSYIILPILILILVLSFVVSCVCCFCCPFCCVYKRRH